MTLLQRRSSEKMRDYQSFACRRLNLDRGRRCPQGPANCAEAGEIPQGRLGVWKEATRGQREGRKGPQLPAEVGTGMRSGPGEYQLTDGAASSLSKRSPRLWGWTLVWPQTALICRLGVPPGWETKVKSLINYWIHLIHMSFV